MDLVLRVLLDGPVLLMLGIVMLLLGGAGLLSTGGASHSPLRTTRPVVFVVQLLVGVLLTTAGLALLFGG